MSIENMKPGQEYALLLETTVVDKYKVLFLGVTGSDPDLVSADDFISAGIFKYYLEQGIPVGVFANENNDEDWDRQFKRV